MGQTGRLTGKEMFIITDNEVFDKTYYKGNSNPPKLNTIV